MLELVKYGPQAVKNKLSNSTDFFEYKSSSNYFQWITLIVKYTHEWAEYLWTDDVNDNSLYRQLMARDKIDFIEADCYINTDVIALMLAFLTQ